MIQIVSIGGTDYGMRVNARIPFLYRYRYGRDLFRDINSWISRFKGVLKADENSGQWTVDELTSFVQFCWLLCWNADNEIEPFEAWYEKLPPTFTVWAAFLPVLNLWNDACLTTSTAKRSSRATTREGTAAIFMLRCFELGLSWEILDHMSVGMVYDLLEEKSNDYEEYPIKANQEDIAKFFG